MPTLHIKFGDFGLICRENGSLQFFDRMNMVAYHIEKDDGCRSSAVLSGKIIRLRR